MESSDPETAYAFPEVDRAWVRMNMVSSLDGSATAGDGLSGSLGGDADRRTYLLLRSLCDVVLVGAGTARAEGYGPVRLDDEARRRRQRLGLSADVPLAIASGRGEVPGALRVPGTILVTTEQGAARSPTGVDVVVAGTDEVDWTVALAALAGRGLRRVLCEGGPRLFGSLSAQDLVDEVCLTVAGTVVLGDGPRVAHADGAVHHAYRLALATPADDALLTRWVRDRS